MCDGTTFLQLRSYLGSDGRVLGRRDAASTQPGRKRQHRWQSCHGVSKFPAIICQMWALADGEEKKTVFYQRLSIAAFHHIVLVMPALLHTFRWEIVSCSLVRSIFDWSMGSASGLRRAFGDWRWRFFEKSVRVLVSFFLVDQQVVRIDKTTNSIRV